MIIINRLEEELKAVQNSIIYCKKEYANETNEHIREKILHYKEGLEKEEERLLNELRRNE